MAGSIFSRNKAEHKAGEHFLICKREILTFAVKHLPASEELDDGEANSSVKGSKEHG